MTKEENALLHDKENPDRYLELLWHLKGFIAVWIVYWPINLVFTLARDPLNWVLDLSFIYGQKGYVVMIQKAEFYLEK